jgi:hypothetical protein
MDVDLGILIPIILFAVAPHIFNRFGIENIYPKIIYMIIVVIIVIFLNIYKVTFSTSLMNDEVATQLVQSIVLEDKPTKREDISNIIHGKRYYNNRGFYNIQAEVSKNGVKYHIYVKAHCKYFQGCTINNFAIIDKNYVDATRGLNYAIPNRDVDGNDLLELSERKLFEEKSCGDFSSLYTLRQEFIKKVSSKANVNEISIPSIKVSENRFFTDESIDGYDYTKSCQATMKVTYKIKDQYKNNFEEISETFSDLNVSENIYMGNVFANYDIYVNKKGRSGIKYKFY